MLTPEPAAPSLGMSNTEPRLSLSAMWIAVRKRWPWVVGAVAAATFAATFLTLGQTKIYQAQTTVLFDPQPPRPLGKEVQAVVDLSGDYMNKKEYYKTQYWILQSTRTASQVVRELALHKSPGFIRNLPADKKLPPQTIAVEDAAKILASRLGIEPIKESRLALVTYQDADPARAQRILAVVVDTYVQNNLDDALEAMSAAADWLGNQTDSLKRDLEANEMALHSYKMAKNILSVSMDDQNNMLRGEIQQLNQALTTTRAQREQIAARRSELLKINPDDPANVPATELLSSQLLLKLRSDYVTARSATGALMAEGKGSNHPDVRAAQSRVEAARTALLAEVKNVQGAVDHDYNVSTNAMNGLSGLLGDAKSRALGLNLLEIEYNRLLRTKDNSEKLFGIVTERAKENDLTRLLRFNNIRVVDRALLPKRPVTPNVPLNIAGGAMLGLVFGLIGAIGRDQLDRSLKTPDDVERELQLTFLGLLPQLAPSGSTPAPPTYPRRRRAKKEEPLIVSKPELIVHEHPTSGIAESARSVRTNILLMCPDKPYQSLLITSAAPSEGKTTVACCVAVAMAQTGKRVVLIDCDMRRPRLHRVFGSNNSQGITTALLDLKRLDEVISPTVVPNLSVLTTGPLPPNPAELLLSESFRRMLAKLKERFDVLIIDSPPVAPVTDATILSTQVDGSIIVVKAFSTRKDVARRAVRALRDVQGKLVGTILNAVNFDRREYGYYQYYYYRNGGYANEAGSQAETPPGSSAPHRDEA
jgi:polysaccharide biosynthesis transport protein